MKKVKILLDTDLGGDCDDVGAIALLNVFANLNEAEILGMTHTTSSKWGPACIDIINRYYNRKNIDIGAYSGKNFLDDSRYNKFAEKMANKFYSPYIDRSLAMDATKFLRKKLSILKNEKCKLIAIGQLNNLANLLKSQKDEVSDLSGYELFLKNVEEVVVMGGIFLNDNQKIIFDGKEYIKEYNIVSDINSAKYFIENCPVKITFIDFVAGYKVKTFGPLLKLGNMDNPISFAYYNFCNSSRESWDPLAIYYAVRGEDCLFNLSKKGIVHVDNQGYTSFEENKNGFHQYLILKVDEDRVAKVIDDIIMNDKIN